MQREERYCLHSRTGHSNVTFFIMYYIYEEIRLLFTKRKGMPEVLFMAGLSGGSENHGIFRKFKKEPPIPAGL